MAQNDPARPAAIERIQDTLDTVRDTEGRAFLIAGLEKLGVDVFGPIKKNGGIAEWRLLGPVPYDHEKDTLDKSFVKEGRIKTDRPCKVQGKSLLWERFTTIEPKGLVDLGDFYGELDGVAAYAYAEVKFPNEQDILLKLGSNDGFKCWFNDKEVGRCDTGRIYQADQDTIHVHANKGVNRILVKIAQEGGAWQFGLRITDPAGNACDAECVTP
jgi:hypothetical protein